MCNLCRSKHICMRAYYLNCKREFILLQKTELKISASIFYLPNSSLALKITWMVRGGGQSSSHFSPIKRVSMAQNGFIDGHFNNKNRFLALRDPILWPPKNFRQIRHDRRIWRWPSWLMLSCYIVYEPYFQPISMTKKQPKLEVQFSRISHFMTLRLPQVFQPHKLF